MIASIVLSVALALASLNPGFGFAGGGGSSSGGGGGGGGFSGGSSYSSSSSSSGDGEVDPFFLLFVTVICIIIIFASSKKGKTNKQIEAGITKNYNDQEKWIHTEAKRIFLQYQQDWTDFNTASIATYTTANYNEHANLMLELLKNLHRVNQVSNVHIAYARLKNSVKQDTVLPVMVNIEFHFSGTDAVIDTTTKKVLYKSYVPEASETWNFIYDGETLKLDGISQPTESAPHLIRSLADFASQNSLFYSPDWGRYALPARGLIFGGASMSIADINNHVIGKWGDLLIQLYSYAEAPNQGLDSYYIVGQINVPKDYLGVIVKSRKFKTARKPDKSYEKFELEWNDFNKRYDVYASSRDALPAFELLNPKFMEFLYNTNPSYNIEVVDNVIYIFANARRVSEKDYAEMLTVLQKAYEELKR